MKLLRIVPLLVVLGGAALAAPLTTNSPLNLQNSEGATPNQVPCAATPTTSSPFWCSITALIKAGSGITITGSGPATISASGVTPGGSANDIQFNSGGTALGGITLTDGQLIVGQSSATPLAKTLSNDCTLSAAGAITCTKLSGAYFSISGPASPTKTFTFPDASATILSTHATVTVTQGGTGASIFTSNLPLIGNGTGAIAQGTISGNTTLFTTMSGTATPGDCIEFDVNGNIQDAGGACGGLSGGGAVSSGPANAIGYYATAGTTISGLTTAATGVLITSSAGTPSIAPLPLANMATIGANTYLGNATGSSAAPSAITIASCSATTSALSYTTSSGFGCQTFGTVVTYSTGATGSTVPLNNGGFTQSGTANFTGTFQIGTQTMSFPAAADTLAGLGTIGTFTAAQTFNDGKLLLKGSSSGSMTLHAPAAASTYSMSFPATTDTVAVLGLANQVMAGGVYLTAASNSTGNVTVNCGLNPVQYIINGGAYTITAPTHDGSCLLMVRNNGSAGATSFFGFTVGSNTGDALDTTSGHLFTISIWRITDGTGSVAGYRVAAMQ